MRHTWHRQSFHHQTGGALALQVGGQVVFQFAAKVVERLVQAVDGFDFAVPPDCP